MYLCCTVYILFHFFMGLDHGTKPLHFVLFSWDSSWYCYSHAMPLFGFVFPPPVATFYLDFILLLHASSSSIHALGVLLASILFTCHTYLNLSLPFFLLFHPRAISSSVLNFLFLTLLWCYHSLVLSVLVFPAIFWRISSLQPACSILHSLSFSSHVSDS